MLYFPFINDYAVLNATGSTDFALALKRPELDERRRLSSQQQQQSQFQQHTNMGQTMYSPRDMPSPLSGWNPAYGTNMGVPYIPPPQQKLKPYQQPLMPGSYDSLDSRNFGTGQKPGSGSGSGSFDSMDNHRGYSNNGKAGEMQGIGGVNDLENSTRSLYLGDSAVNSNKLNGMGIFPPAISSTTAAAVSAAVAVTNSLSSLGSSCINLVVPPPQPPQSDALSISNSPATPQRKSLNANPDTDPFFGDDSV
jgi:hypothetical protein